MVTINATLFSIYTLYQEVVHVKLTLDAKGDVDGIKGKINLQFGLGLEEVQNNNG